MTVSVATTLSLAMNPVTSAADTRQSPKPSGANSGETKPETTASMLSFESATAFRWKSNVCRNQIAIVAMKMIVKARCKKSFALSHISRSTFFSPGRR